MEPAHAVGLLLVGLSAGLLASHRQQHLDMRGNCAKTLHSRIFYAQQLRRRTLASSLVGLLGAALTVHDEIPPGPLSISFYLFGLIFLTIWILCLGLIDLTTMRHQRQREQIDRIAAEFRRANLSSDAKESIEV